jgi:TRAP-type transport system periplasmic protein
VSKTMSVAKHIKNRWAVRGLLLGALLNAETAVAGPLRVKLGTLAPEDSPWHTAIQRMGQAWKTASNGDVRVTIYAGAVQGDEADVIRKMRIGQLQAGSVTSIGLSRLTRSAMALQVPMLVDSYEQLDYIRDRITPAIESEIRDAGFEVLHWADAGWVYFFAKSDAMTPAAYSKLKFFVWNADPESERAFKQSGFNAVPMSVKDVVSGLQTGLVEAFGTTPLYALSSQWFGLAPYMVNLKWTPLSGATIMSLAAWSKLSPALQVEFKRVARELGESFKVEVRALEGKAVKAMVDRGLKIHEPTPKEMEEWVRVGAVARKAARGEAIPAKFFDEAVRLAAEYKSTQAVVPPK